MKKSMWVVAILAVALTATSAMAQSGSWSKLHGVNIGNSQGGGYADLYAYANINTASTVLPCQGYVDGYANAYLWNWNKQIAYVRGNGELRNDKLRLWGQVKVMGSTVYAPDYSADLYYSKTFSWSPSYTFFQNEYFFTVCMIPCSISGAIGGNPRANAYGYVSPTRLDLYAKVGAYAWGTAAGAVGIPYLAQFKLGTTLKVCDSGTSGTASLRWTGRSGSIDASFTGLSADFWYSYTYAVFFKGGETFATYSTPTKNWNLFTL